MKKKSDSSENSCGGGMWLPPPPPSSPCSPTSQFEYDSMMNVDTTTHQTTLDYFENLHNSYSSSLLDDERSIISSSSNNEPPQKLIGKNDEEAESIKSNDEDDDGAKEKTVTAAAAAVGAEETSGGGITVGTETQGSITTTKSDDVTLQELEVTKEEEVATVRNYVVVAAINTALAKEETVGGTEGATLGGSPIPSPSQHTDMHGDGSVSCAPQGQRRDVVVGTSSVEQKGKSTPIKTKSAAAAVEVLSSRSPTTSESEYDSINATTHQTTRAFDNLHNSYSFSLLDNEEEEDDEESISLVGVSIDVGKDFMTCCQFEFACPDNDSSEEEAKVSSDDVGRDSTICCQFESAFPDNVHDVNEILSTDLHSLTIQEELLLLNDWILLDETGGDNTQGGEGGLGLCHKLDALDEQQGGDEDGTQQQQQQQSLNQQQGQPSTTQEQQQQTRKSHFYYRRHNNDNKQRGCHGIKYRCVTFNEDDEVFVYDNNTTNNNNRLYSCNVGHEMSDMYNTNESSHKDETDSILAEVTEEDEEREAWGEGVNCCWI